jgi:hypothetical protein
MFIISSVKSQPLGKASTWEMQFVFIFVLLFIISSVKSQPFSKASTWEMQKNCSQ